MDFAGQRRHRVDFPRPRVGVYHALLLGYSEASLQTSNQSEWAFPHVLSQVGDREPFRIVEPHILTSQNATISKSLLATYPLMPGLNRS